MKNEWEKMLAGEPYDARHPALVGARERARTIYSQINAMPPMDVDRRELLRQLFGSGGESVTLTSPFFCDYGSNIQLGEGVFFNFNCVVLDVCRVRIGARTLVGPAVQIYTPLHPMDAVQRREQESGRPVDIGEDVWIGGGAVILPGVSIGDRAVIGAGSVVTRDVPAGAFAAGNPCQVIRAVA